ncbi:MAG: hypothetical protein LWY06_06280 [Firmicutes bacterium]|nr:hypothetical protein [Bacillota bacterium]
MTDILTYTSHNEGEFDENMLSKRRRQMKLGDKTQLSDFINCRFSEDDYKKWIIENHEEA